MGAGARKRFLRRADVFDYSDNLSRSVKKARVDAESAVCEFSILHINIRGFRTNCVELLAYLHSLV